MMKYSKELKTGAIAIVSVVLLVAGINFLKGNSFFGGDDLYYAYFSESGGLTSGTSVYVNGVIVGKITNIKLSGLSDKDKKVLITFNIQDKDFKIPKESIIYTGNADLLNKGIIIVPNDKTKEYYKPNEYLMGQVGAGMLSEVREFADPLMQNLQMLAMTLNKFVGSLSNYWDSTANVQMSSVLTGVQRTLSKFEMAATQFSMLMGDERSKLVNIFSNVESIVSNLQKSNAQITAILANVEGLTHNLVTSDLQGTLKDARSAISKFDETLDLALKGDGTLGKLIADDELYKELNETNQQLQDLLDDFEQHPERYIRVSVFGGKIKGTNLSTADERKLRQLLDSIPSIQK